MKGIEMTNSQARTELVGFGFGPLLRISNEEFRTVEYLRPTPEDVRIYWYERISETEGQRTTSDKSGVRR